MPPSPPPPPDPPPITLRYGPDPPSPPPPVNPPPYYQSAEECVPLPSLAYFGLDDTVERVDDAISEERASCLFVRRVVDERRRASSCFALVADPHPPPPPYMSSSSRSGELNLRLQRDRLGELEEYKAPRKTDRAKWNADTGNAISKTQALIDSLGENDPILRAMLRDAIGEMEAAGPQGRRLLERNDYEIKMTDALIHDDLMDEFGRDGIPGVTVGSCEALCEASRQDANRTDERECGAFAFKRQAPFSYTDLTGRCWLLQHAGACKTADFGVELYTRQIESERQCSALAPGLDNPACLAMPATTDDSRVLAHGDAAAIAHQVPNDRYPAPGSRGLPQPRTTLESMSMLAYARANVRNLNTQTA